MGKEKWTTVTVYLDGWPTPKHGEAAFRRALLQVLAEHGMSSRGALISVDRNIRYSDLSTAKGKVSPAHYAC